MGYGGAPQRTLTWNRDLKAKREGSRLISGERVYSRQWELQVQRPWGGSMSGACELQRVARESTAECWREPDVQKRPEGWADQTTLGLVGHREDLDFI